MREPFKNTIVTVPNNQLNKTTKKVVHFDEALKQQVKLMSEVLKKEGGVGLAANQIDFDNQVLVLEFDSSDDQKENIPFQVLINPEIAECSKDLDSASEGCLSVPLIELPILRSIKIKVKANNEQGKKIKFSAKGLHARIIQHEIDHLNGILFTDRIRDKYKKDFPELYAKKFVFIGTGSFALPLLKGLIILGLDVKMIITEKGKPSGRNNQIELSPVAKLAKEFNSDYSETNNISDLENDIKNTSPDLIILSDFGQKIPESILKLAKIAPLNFHPSLLPKYRGATPIPSTILAGEKETGVSIIKMVPEIDKGPVLAQIKTDILAIDNSVTLEHSLSMLALDLMFEVLPKVAQNQLKPLEINENDASYTHKFTKADGQIDWKKNLIVIERQIRAFYPWPGTYTTIDNKRLIIHKAHIKGDKLVIDLVQLEGQKPIKFKDFLNGWRDQKPDWFKKIKY